MTNREKLKEWWERVKEILFPPRPQREPNQQGGKQPDAPQDGPRYEVKDQSGQTVAEGNSLADAHQQWQDLTDQQGSIIDTQTGEDVTPEPDDMGRYVLLDKDDGQLGSFGRSDKAIEAWRQQTGERGKVIDTKTGEDISAKLKGYLTNEQLKQALQLVAGHNVRASELGIDPTVVQEMMRQLNKMDLPIFNIANIAGRGKKPGKKVPITRRKVTIEKVKRKVWVDRPFTPPPNGRIAVPYATDDQEPRRMRSISELTRVRPAQLTLPPALLGRRIASRDFTVTEYSEETPSKPQMRKRQEFQEFEEPKVEEWTEEVEISDDPRAQLLEIVIDVSGSMRGYNICLAVALAAVLIGKHLDDDSRYLYRQFADNVSRMRLAENEPDKKALISFLITQREDPDVGGGTNIKIAIDTAAQDVRTRAVSDDQPEILLITDGGDSISSMEVYEAILNDVILHAVNVGDSPNWSLKERASTFYQLDWRRNKVEGSKDGNLPQLSYEERENALRKSLGLPPI